MSENDFVFSARVSIATYPVDALSDLSRTNPVSVADASVHVRSTCVVDFAEPARAVGAGGGATSVVASASFDQPELPPVFMALTL